MNKIISIVLILVLVVAGYIYWAVRDLPAIDNIMQTGVNPTQWTQVYGADGTPVMSYGKYRHRRISLKEVSPHFIDALLATEDRRFYYHIGVDPIALLRAILRDVVHRKLLEGGSTLTQQLARNVFLSNERSMRRKVREAALALELERKLTKTQILELYINNTYFGEGAYGIQAASEIFFNKKPSQLTVPEAALLAGMPQAPSKYSPFQDKEAAKARRDEVLGNLKAVGKITQAQYDYFISRPIHFNASGKELAAANRAPYFSEYIMRQIQQQFDLDEQSFWQSGYTVYTTLDPYAQRLAALALRNLSVTYGRTKPKQQAALLTINPKTGGILAYVGGKNYQTSQFDRVAQAIRSPGSLFKIFTYATAVDKGYAPNRVYLDEPIHIGNWSPQNYDRQHHGYMTMAKALAFSNNMVAVKVLSEMTPQTVIDTARRMGIRSQLQNDLTLTLGGSGVTLLDMTSAFGVLANQGVRVEPYGIEKITDRDGRVIYQHQTVTVNVLSRATVDTMVNMMTGVVMYGTGKAANIGRPMAGKTGTSDDHRDSWFIGFTPDVITGVWVGNDDNSPMPGMTGGALPAQIWRTYMSQYLANKMITNFDLAYSLPISENDFITYDLKNLSPAETNSPLAPAGRVLPTATDAEMAPDPSLNPDGNGSPETPPSNAYNPAAPGGGRTDQIPLGGSPDGDIPAPEPQNNGGGNLIPLRHREPPHPRTGIIPLPAPPPTPMPGGDRRDNE